MKAKRRTLTKEDLRTIKDLRYVLTYGPLQPFRFGTTWMVRTAARNLRALRREGGSR